MHANLCQPKIIKYILYINKNFKNFKKIPISVVIFFKFYNFLYKTNVMYVCLT